MTQTFICNKSCINYDTNNIIIKTINNNYKLTSLNNKLTDFDLLLDNSKNIFFGLFPIGNHFLLITNNKYKKSVILYDIQKNKYFDVKYRFKDDIYNNTILECILTKTSNKWQLIVFNIISYKNNNISSKPIGYKFNIIENLISNEYINDNYIQPAELKLITYTKDSKTLESLVNNYNIDEEYIFYSLLTIIDNDYYLIDYNVNTKLNLSSFKYLDNIDIDLYDEDCEILDVNDNTIEEVFEKYISKTDYRDVYKIKDTEMFVNIPTINLSKAIKKKFTNNNLTHLKVYCKYNSLYDNYNVIKL